MNFVDFLIDNNFSIPDKPFLLGKEQLNYKELYSKAGSLACHLKEKYGENKKIMICSPNNVFFIISYLAVIKSGNVCIPIDPVISKGNLNYLLEQTNPVTIFSGLRNHDFPKEGQFEIYTENDLSGLCYQKEYLNDDMEFNAERLAEIIYTSGSTGLPKGVMLSHKNLISNTKSIIKYLHLTNSDRMLVVLPFYYCYGLSLLHTHLKCKGSIVINSPFMFLGGVINDLLKYKCTGLAGVPSHFQVLLRKTKAFVTTEFPDLRYVTQAGGRLHNVFIEEFTSAFKKIEFYVMYGQTEATARLSYLPYEYLKTKIGSIGKGIPGVELKVVNEDYSEIKPGESGEIIARGDNIMAGYYLDEELTRKTLVNDWLKTGDLATIDEDGFIYLIARSKEIIKIRGKRVSPKEIEDSILKLPDVIDCSVSAIFDELEGEALQAHILLCDKSTGKMQVHDILNHCAKELEVYKIPRKIVFMDKLNVQATGKRKMKIDE